MRAHSILPVLLGLCLPSCVLVKAPFTIADNLVEGTYNVGKKAVDATSDAYDRHEQKKEEEKAKAEKEAEKKERAKQQQQQQQQLQPMPGQGPAPGQKNGQAAPPLFPANDTLPLPPIDPTLPLPPPR